MQIELSADHFKPHYKYENMSNVQIQFILKIIPIDQNENVIFNVLNQAIDMLISTKHRLGEDFKFNFSTRIKLAVIYNNFPQRFPDLYGNIYRYISIFQHMSLIFETYVNDKGDDVYYLAFTCDPRNRSFEKYEQTDSIVIGGEVRKKGQWSEEINIDFTKNKSKKKKN
jgi:hypothetical protein